MTVYGATSAMGARRTSWAFVCRRQRAAATCRPPGPRDAGDRQRCGRLQPGAALDVAQHRRGERRSWRGQHRPGACGELRARGEAFPGDDRRAFCKERDREIGSPAATVPTTPSNTADLERFFENAHRSGYWLGCPADNAAVGIALDGSQA
jgi:hypothetical protein